jgi:hypothetical protein
MNEIELLAAKVESTFASDLKLMPHERRILFPDSFKGGFVLAFSGYGGSIEVEYLDMQFEARIGEVELFGPKVHPKFSGNMFSREHLAEHLPQLVAVVRSQLATLHPVAG